MMRTRARVRVLLLLVIAAGSTARGDEPDRLDLFRAGDGGYELYRIPGLVAAKDGTVLAYCEARRRAGGDWGPIDLYLRRSEDDGRTWGPPTRIVSPPVGSVQNPVAIEQGLARPGEITLNNPVAIIDEQDGSIHFLFCVSYARCFSMRSTDGGRTWTEPVDITAAFDAFRPEYPWRVLATGPGHGIQLRSGRLVVPVWLSTGTGGHAHRPSAVSTIFSDDHGRTWHRGAIVVRDPDPVNPSETAAVELADGRVMLNIRHESEPHLRVVVVGPDGAGGWSPMRLDEALPDPVCFGTIARLSMRPGSDRNRLLFANLHNPDGRERKNLSVKLSYDEGETWPVMKVIEPGPSGYSDLAVASDGTILCLFERGALKGATQPSALTLARFDLGWLTDGEDALPVDKP